MLHCLPHCLHQLPCPFSILPSYCLYWLLWTTDSMTPIVYTSHLGHQLWGDVFPCFLNCFCDHCLHCSPRHSVIPPLNIVYTGSPGEPSTLPPPASVVFTPLCPNIVYTGSSRGYVFSSLFTLNTPPRAVAILIPSGTVNTRPPRYYHWV